MTQKLRLIWIIVGLALLISAGVVKHQGHQAAGIGLSLLGFLFLVGHFLWKNKAAPTTPEVE